MMKIGIIGGSGLYELEGFEKAGERKLKTPFGAPSDAYVHGTLAGRDVFFLPRHGRGHRILPSEINHRANIMGFKMLGVDRIVSVSAVGSLKEQLRPRDIILPDQYFDRTKGSLQHTFFGEGIVGHVTFADPTCADLRAIMAGAVKKTVARTRGSDVRVVVGGTYVNMEGPAFSTKAESRFNHQMGFDVIGMTSLPEAKLCREAEICYQSMAMVTDYDCWREAEEVVTLEMILGHLNANTKLAKAILVEAICSMPRRTACSCGESLKTAIVTSLKIVPAKTRKKLRAIIGKYL